MNLISNAIKYSPERTTVDIMLEMKAETLQIVVEDEGLGFTPEDQSRLFQRFTTLSAKPTRGEASPAWGYTLCINWLSRWRAGHGRIGRPQSRQPLYGDPADLSLKGNIQVFQKS